MGWVGGWAAGVERGGGDGRIAAIRFNRLTYQNKCQAVHPSSDAKGYIDRGWGDGVKLSGCQSHYIILQNHISAMIGKQSY